MTKSNRKDLELYVHIPFCVKKCYYCDFLSAPASAEERQKYVESLCKRIRSYTELAQKYQVVSIFIGGGTPSILEASQMEAVFEALRDTFFILPDAENTIEVNPGTVTQEKLRSYRKSGINRLSIGLQSASDAELKLLGRIHTWQDFLGTYRMSRQEGFENINIDLISAIPGQTLETWERTLRTVTEQNPEHISAYSLIIEEGTPFYRIYGDGCSQKQDSPLPDEDTERLIYQNTKRILEEYGYYRYEISNYAKPGYECRHNLGYWSRAEYLGIGMGAASLLDNHRWVEGEIPEILSKENQMEEFLFLGLRKIKGVSKSEFERLFETHIHCIYGDVIRDLKEKGLLEEKGDFLFLTERGIDISNYVMSEFLL